MLCLEYSFYPSPFLHSDFGWIKSFMKGDWSVVKDTFIHKISIYYI